MSHMRAQATAPSRGDAKTQPAGKSKRLMPSGKDLWPMIKQTFSDFFEDKAQTLAAALAIYTMLSIAPMLVIVTKVVGVMSRDAQAKENVVQTMRGVIPGMSDEQLRTMIE